jgi:nicotinate-nucleotide--dimethylbenzimidazole phosphoribosyltransferase
LKTFEIEAPSKNRDQALQHKIDFKTKPIGALGRVEQIAKQIGLIQNTLSPVLNHPHIVVFAGDHGIAHEGVSAYPQEVTWQMVMNFVSGGAAINVFCKQHTITLKVVDAGVNYTFPEGLTIMNAKIALGTKSFLSQPAMAIHQAEACIAKGATIVNEIFQEGCNVIGFGEMGIANTSSASILMSLLGNFPLEECVGKGTGLNNEQLDKKINILKSSIQTNGIPATTLESLAIYGGFEIVQLCGAMLQAAENKMIILVDGFIASVAFLSAYKMNPAVIAYAIFSHQSNERAHPLLLDYLKASPLLKLDMRLGEGTGCALAYPLVQSAINFLNEMASFESAGVSNKEIKIL